MMNTLQMKRFKDAIYKKAIDDVMKKASEIQKQQIEELQKSNRRNGKMWAKYMTTYLGHIQVACMRMLKEQLKKDDKNKELSSQ